MVSTPPSPTIRGSSTSAQVAELGAALAAGSGGAVGLP